MARDIWQSLLTQKEHLICTNYVLVETMRRLGVNMPFAFDPHFHEQGFLLLT